MFSVSSKLGMGLGNCFLTSSLEDSEQTIPPFSPICWNKKQTTAKQIMSILMVLSIFPTHDQTRKDKMVHEKWERIQNISRIIWIKDIGLEGTDLCNININNRKLNLKEVEPSLLTTETYGKLPCHVIILHVHNRTEISSILEYQMLQGAWNLLHFRSSTKHT
jgi:hypothetical protein